MEARRKDPVKAVCMCGHLKDFHASGPGFSFTYCKSPCDCEGYEEPEDVQREVGFEYEED